MRVTRGEPHGVPAWGDRAQEEELEGQPWKGAEGSCDSTQVTMSPAPGNWTMQMLGPEAPRTHKSAPKRGVSQHLGIYHKEGTDSQQNNARHQ